jgi:C1A family cysteine protease
MTDLKKKYAMGWTPDYPDIRDHTEQKEEIKMILGAKGPLKARSLPSSIDLREWYSPVEDQGAMGSCTAHAGVGVIEY